MKTTETRGAVVRVMRERADALEARDAVEATRLCELAMRVEAMGQSTDLIELYDVALEEVHLATEIDLCLYRSPRHGAFLPLELRSEKAREWAAGFLMSRGVSPKMCVPIRGVWGRVQATNGRKQIGWIRCLAVDGRHYVLKATDFVSLAGMVERIKVRGSIDMAHWTLDGVDETPAYLETTANAEYVDANG